MIKNKQNLPLRSGVGIVVLNKENKIFVAKRIDNPKNFWQMPQGGIDKNENYYEAALRELREETSITSVELIKEIIKFEGELVFDLDKPDGNPRKLLDSSKINNLGWSPKTKLREGIEKTYNWYKDN